MKQKRQQKIVELIEHQDIETQEELAEKLNNAGYQVTQATISRDIRELKLSKVSLGSGKQKYIIMRREEELSEDKYIRMIRDGYLSIEVAQNFLVLKTNEGLAMAVAAAIDAMEIKEILGSIAGDDTIMLAHKNMEDAIAVKAYIHEIVGV